MTLKLKLLTSFVLCLLVSSSLLAADRKPNVIVFLVDDMGWMDCGAYGSKYYETPNIDRFATRAMRFTDAYAQPLCSPTRCSLLTGKYSARHGITAPSGHLAPQPAGFKFLPESAPTTQPTLVPQSKNYMEPAEYTLAEALRDAGYQTAHIGKWHLGITQPHWPEQQGFQFAFHCHPDPGPPGGYFSPYGVSLTGNAGGKNKVGTITDGPDGEYIVDRLADEAVKFIAANKGRPFFLNLWNYGVHGPWGHKVEYTQAFASKKDPRGVQGNPIMASMLKSVDQCFGRIVDELEKQGLADNTIVVFNSDNGGNSHSNTDEDAKRGAASAQLADWRKWAGNQPPTVNTPLRDGKGTLYEGGTRVPLMWAWPQRIKPGSTTDAVVAHIDLYPTLLDLIGLPKPAEQKFDGVSYSRVLKSEGRLERRAFFNYFPHGPSPGRAGGVWVRSGDWKLIRWFGLLKSDERFELFNLRDDLSESKNLAAVEAARVKELDALIDQFLIDTEATYPRPNPAYKPDPAKPSASIKKSATDDPLEGWKARQCDVVVKDGVLSMTSTHKPGTAFLGFSMGKQAGPVAVKFRVRSAAGGTGKVEWLGDVAAGAQPQSVAFKIEAGEWREVTVELPAKGLLGITRLYLPAGAQPVDVDWIEVSGKGPNSMPMRWGFDAR